MISGLRPLCALAGLAGLVGLAAVAPPRRAAAQGGIAVSTIAPGEVRVDGQLSEWQGVRFGQLGDQDGARLEYALALDPQALYVGARVWDDRFIRSERPSPKEDAVVLRLSTPSRAGRWATSEVWLYAGIVGKTAARASIAGPRQKPRPASEVQVVEGPTAGHAGYLLEARIPLASLPGARDLQVARAALVLHDVDRVRGRPVRLATAERMPPLRVGANVALEQFLRHHDLTPASLRHDFVGDVAGDDRCERVAIADTFIVVVGPEIEGGTGFHFVDLPISRGAAVRSARLRDLTGDGKRELVLTTRTAWQAGTQEVFQVFDLGSGPPHSAFSVVTRRELEGGSVAAELRVGRARGAQPPTIEVAIGKARGVSAGDYEAAAPSEPPGQGALLVPWGKTKRRVYRWDGVRFAMVSEEPNEAYEEPGARLPPGSLVASVTSAQPVAERSAARVELPGEQALIAEFRRARGIDSGVRPRFPRRVNLAEDSRPETAMIFGRELVILGEGFRGGQGFLYFALPVDEPAAIQRVFTGDVTGDARRELFVRIKRLVQDAGGRPVQREVLLGYSFGSGEPQQILQVEVRRARDDGSVGNIVELVREGSHWALSISPGVARGWSARSYPFAAEPAATGALLLPWRDRPARYLFDGERLRRP